MGAKLLAGLVWLLRLLAAPAAARDQGRREAEAERLNRTIEVQRDQLQAAARPRRDRDDLLGRMRDGRL